MIRSYHYVYVLNTISWLALNKWWLCAEFENTCFQQILPFLAHFWNYLGGGIKLTNLKRLGLETKYSSQTDFFFIFKHILDFRYLKYLKIDLTSIFFALGSVSFPTAILKDSICEHHHCRQWYDYRNIGLLYTNIC